MNISSKKIKKTLAAKRVFAAAQVVLTLHASAVLVFIFYNMITETVSIWPSILIDFAGIVSVLLLFNIPNLSNRAAIKAMGFSYGQVLYVANLRISADVERVEVIGVNPYNKDEPVEITPAERCLLPCYSDYLFLTYEEARERLDKEIKDMIKSVKNYAGYEGELSKEDEAKILRHYSRFVKTVAWSVLLIKDSYHNPTWLAKFMDYIKASEGGIFLKDTVN